MTSISFEYKDHAVTLSESVCQNFIDALSSAFPDAETSNEHHWSPSAYQVMFDTETTSVDVTFFWFSGRQMTGDRIFVTDGDPHQPYQYVDDRFDVLVNDSIFSFRFQKGNLWTEDTSRSVYDHMASLSDSPRRGTIDGFTKWTESSPSYIAPDETWTLIIDQCDIVLLATYIGKSDNIPNQWPYYYGLDTFQTEQVLKGSAESQISLLSFYGSHTVNNEAIAVLYPVCNPPYQEGKTYLLFLTLSGNPDDPTGGLRELDYYGSGAYSVLLEEGTLYPRYNTEHHPFYQITINQIIDYLDPEN